MRWSRYYFSTARETPADVRPAGRQLMARAGLIRKGLAAGTWSHLPFGCRSLAKLAALARRELDAAGSQELDLARDLTATDLLRPVLQSHRQLPVSFHQIRDLKADVWAFAAHPEIKDEVQARTAAWQEMQSFFGRLFAACRLSPGPVETFGSSLLLVPAESGGIKALRCPLCGYAATTDKAATRIAAEDAAVEDAAAEAPHLREVKTPGMKTVEDVARFFGVPPYRVVKTLLYETEKGVVAALARGDREINESKLADHLGVSRLHLAGEEVVRATTSAPVGFAGPIGLPGVHLVADETVGQLNGFVCGANRADTHFVDVHWGRDILLERRQYPWPRMGSTDLLRVREGDACPRRRCEGTLEAFRGFAVGEIAGPSIVPVSAFTDDSGTWCPLWRSSYSLDLGEILAVAVEQSHDGDGILWPRPLAPFEALLVALNPDAEAVRTAADQLYGGLLEQGADVLYDDRGERPGVKFKDADLVGFPVRLVVGAKSLAAGNVEISLRSDREKRQVPVAEAVSRVLALLEE